MSTRISAAITNGLLCAMLISGIACILAALVGG
jgi:hypothetical protein